MAISLELARKRIEESRDIPTLSPVALRIQQLVDDPGTSARDLANLISKDPVLTAVTLRLVNSAFYGLQRRIGNVTRAIILLGFQRVKYIAMTASVMQAMGNSRFSSFNYKGFWLHSLATGLAADALARRMAPDWSEDAMAAGLLHDVGKLALSMCLKDQWLPLIAKAKRGEGCLIRDLEQQALGFDHAEAGSWLAERWRLPPSICQSIRYHHQPGQATSAEDLVHVIHLSDVLTRGLGLGDPGDALIPKVNQEAWSRAALDTKTTLRAFYRDLLKRFEATSDILEEIK